MVLQTAGNTVDIDNDLSSFAQLQSDSNAYGVENDHNVKSDSSNSKIPNITKVQTTVSNAVKVLQDLPTKLKDRIGFKETFETYLSAYGNQKDVNATMDALREVNKSIDTALGSGKLSELQAEHLKHMQVEIAATVG